MTSTWMLIQVIMKWFASFFHILTMCSNKIHYDDGRLGGFYEQFFLVYSRVPHTGD